MISPAQNSRCPSNRIFVFGACLSRHVTFSLTSLQSFNSYTHFAHVSNFPVLKKKIQFNYRFFENVRVQALKDTHVVF